MMNFANNDFLEDPGDGETDPFDVGEPKEQGEDLGMPAFTETSSFMVDDETAVTVLEDNLGPPPKLKTRFKDLIQDVQVPDLIKNIDNLTDITGGDYPEPFEKETVEFPSLDDGTFPLKDNPSDVNEYDGEYNFNKTKKIKRS